MGKNTSQARGSVVARNSTTPVCLDWLSQFVLKFGKISKTKPEHLKKAQQMTLFECMSNPTQTSAHMHIHAYDLNELILLRISGVHLQFFFPKKRTNVTRPRLSHYLRIKCVYHECCCDLSHSMAIIVNMCHVSCLHLYIYLCHASANN